MLLPNAISVEWISRLKRNWLIYVFQKQLKYRREKLSSCLRFHICWKLQNTLQTTLSNTPNLIIGQPLKDFHLMAVGQGKMTCYLTNLDVVSDDPRKSLKIPRWDATALRTVKWSSLASSDILDTTAALPSSVSIMLGAHLGSSWDINQLQYSISSLDTSAAFARLMLAGWFASFIKYSRKCFFSTWERSLVSATKAVEAASRIYII